MKKCSEYESKNGKNIARSVSNHLYFILLKSKEGGKINSAIKQF